MSEQIIRDVTSSLDNIELLPGNIKDIVTTIFVESLTNVWRMRNPSCSRCVLANAFKSSRSYAVA
jgi:hypothetical protein